MLGRGAVTRPDLVASIKNADISMVWQALIPHQIAFLQDNTDNQNGLIGRYKQWLGMLTKGYAEAENLWESVKKEKDKGRIIELIKNS